MHKFGIQAKGIVRQGERGQDEIIQNVSIPGKQKRL